MSFTKENNALIFRNGYEILRLESWGKDALRVRATVYPSFTGRDWALTEDVSKYNNAEITIEENKATIKNGMISAEINFAGIITFYRDGKKILREHYRNYYGSLDQENQCQKIISREFKPIIGGDYRLTVRFEPNDDEKIYGMGQYQQKYLDLKGCTLHLAQRNSEVSVPFEVSSMGYGFLWNNPSVGEVAFGKNIYEWKASCTKEMDYYIVAGEDFADIETKYADATGHASEFPEDLMGLWQCKLRYRTQEEVLSVARKYYELGIRLDVIVIDFFHFMRQGDWAFDKEYWPDPKAMCDELHSHGTKVVVSVWPTVDKKSTHFGELSDLGFLIRTEHGTNQTYDWQGDCLEIDVTNPKAQEYIWKVCKENYADLGIDMFWLDNIEPDFNVYDYENYRYYLGTALEVSNIYPKKFNEAFYMGEKSIGNTHAVNLIRSAWAGSQKYGALVWSGDVMSTFESLRDQVQIGINMGLAGIPWWNTDIGGFMCGDVRTDEFKELLVRWFEYAVFTPVLRMHGDRDPHDVPALSDKEFGGGYLYTGRDNEFWSYGEKVQEILTENLSLREKMIPYIKQIFGEASRNGAPLIRGLFYEFPSDERCYEISDEYMFGSKYLVAPILEYGARSREVYLPEGKWTEIHTGTSFEGGKSYEINAPLEYIPVFEHINHCNFQCSSQTTLHI